MHEPNTRRRRMHDATATRTAILDAAETIFAEQGFAGARIDAIAARADSNKSLIFQYFDDKLTLYAQVLQRTEAETTALQASLFAPLLTHVDLATDAQQLRTFLTTAFGAVFDHLLARPQLLRILQWELAEGWKTYAQISPQLPVDHIDQLASIFDAAQRAGLVRSAFSPVVQLTMALQTCQSYLASLPLYQVLMPNQDMSSTAAIAAARQHIVTAIVAGILVDPPRPIEHEEPQ